LKRTTPSTTIERRRGSTGFMSNADDAVNAERAVEMGREMQMKLDGKSVKLTMEVKFKVQALSSLRNLRIRRRLT